MSVSTRTDDAPTAPLDTGRVRGGASGADADAAAHGLSRVQSNQWVMWAGLGTLLLLFVWLYARFVGRLYFVLDDYIETEFALARTWSQAIVDSFDGTINWSGYRPLTYAVRATLAHALGLQQMWGYFAFSMGLLLAN
ncbi:MAG: hypothetical protein ACRC1H_16390, partial [Caldilineaceae bacterium]